MIQEILDKAKKLMRSIRPMSLNQWAEQNGRLSAESSAEIGKWKSFPYQAIIMDAISSGKYEGIVVKKSARIGYTKILDHTIGYHIEHKPRSILIVQPTVEDAEGFSKEELAPYLRDVECLQGLVSDAKAKDGTNAILHKLFPGGVLSIIGANSPRGFRRISRSLILLDEVSGYPKSAGAEGNPVSLAIRRSEFFADRLIIAGSTPTLTEECEITRMYEETDQRRYFVPCPHCGFMQYLKFSNLKWPDENPMDAFFECESCKQKIEHKYKRKMIEKGEFLPTAESRKNRWIGFHLWAAYSFSPNSTWGHIAKEFLEAKKGGREKLQTYVNTVLGETFDDSFFEKNNIEELQARAESYPLGTAPEKVIFATAGVDVQDNRIAVEVHGWGPDDETWVINYMEIYGNPADSKVWKSLDALLDAPIIHEKYKDIKIKACAVDTGGHYTHEVYNYCRDRKLKNVIAIKGSSHKNRPAIGKPTSVDVNYKGKTLKRGVKLYSLGVDTIKSVIYSRLKILEKGAKYIHFSNELTDEFYKGLQSERKIVKIKRGIKVIEWAKTHERNEPLDCFVYSFAAKEFLLTKYPKKLAYTIVEKELILKNSESSENLKETEEKTVDDKALRKNKTPVNSRKRGGFVKNW